MGKIIYFDFKKFYKLDKKKIYTFFFNLSIENSLLYRWKNLKKIRSNYEIHFSILKNDGSPKNLKSLWVLKQLFENQLPNIPRSYITRLIFDKNHESIILKKFKKKKFQIIGGCSFRLFKRQQILELVFFAVKTKYQTKGYGSQLISLLKDYSRFLGFKNIITCADNNATNFFFKQGFSPTISLPKIFWSGFIRDYEDVILMEFTISSKFNYGNLNFFLFSIIVFGYFSFLDCIKKLFTISPVLFKKKKKKKILKNKNLVFFLKKKFSRIKKGLKFQKKIIFYFDRLKLKDFVFPFLEPSKGTYYFDKEYFTKVFNAMDLRIMEEKFRIGYYNNFSLFLGDFKKILINCRLYNGINHLTSENCSSIEILIEKLKKKKR